MHANVQTESNVQCISFRPDEDWKCMEDVVNNFPPREVLWEMKLANGGTAPFVFCGNERIAYLDRHAFDYVTALEYQLVRPFHGTLKATSISDNN